MEANRGFPGERAAPDPPVDRKKARSCSPPAGPDRAPTGVRYVGHPVHKVKAFEIKGPYRLRIEFGDGLVRIIDFRPVLEGELYGPLRDLDQFNAVSLDREVQTLVWPNGADFDPATL